jgi:hypothetical protein
VRASFERGCAGTFVFAWTDQWERGGHEVRNWDFGITTRDRTSKPALHRVGRAYAGVPVDESRHWPRVSVVVCTHNGAPTIEETLEGLGELGA